MAAQTKTFKNQIFINKLQECLDLITDPNNKIRFTFAKAIKALRDCNHVLINGDHAKKELKGVGDKIAGILNKMECKGDGSTIDPSELPAQSKTTTAQKNQAPAPAGPSAPQPAKKRKKKEYIPTFRSGGYAILLALFRHGNSTFFLNKSDIIKYGCQYCNSSFTMPQPGSNHPYTAWNSMTKLVKEDLVSESGNPKRYCLTDEGLELASRLSTALDKRKGDLSQGTEDIVLNSELSSELESFVEMTSEMGAMNEGSSSKLNPNSALKESLVRAPPPVYKSRSWQSLEQRLFTNNPKPISTSSNSNLNNPNINTANINNPNIINSKTNTTNSTVAPLKQSSAVNRSNSAPEAIPRNLDISKFYTDMRKKESEVTRNTMKDFSGSFQRLEPGTFEVLLVLDNREVRSRKDRDFFQLELEKRQVKVLTMPLDLGDICWVARSKTNHQEMYMLDYIVERKAKEDLIQSIQDGRFKEQKHRLSKSGIGNIIYLIEEVDIASFKNEALATALTETQIIHGFFVKQCLNVQDTVNYLVYMTHILVEKHEKSPLRIMNAIDLNADTHHIIRSHLSNQGTPHLIPLTLFSELNRKTKNLTTDDIWMKQLMTIRGVSGEKAMVLSKHFKSLMDFIEKLEAAGTEENQIKLIMNCSQASHRRQFGKALAKQIISILLGQ